MLFEGDGSATPRRCKRRRASMKGWRPVDALAREHFNELFRRNISAGRPDEIQKALGVAVADTSGTTDASRRRASMELVEEKAKVLHMPEGSRRRDEEKQYSEMHRKWMTEMRERKPDVEASGGGLKLSKRKAAPRVLKVNRQSMSTRALWPGEMAKYYESKCNPGGVTVEEHAWRMMCLQSRCVEELSREEVPYMHIGMTYLLQALAGLAGQGRRTRPGAGECAQELGLVQLHRRPGLF